MLAIERVPKPLRMILLAGVVLSAVVQLEYATGGGRNFATGVTAALRDGLPAAVERLHTPRAGETEVLPRPVLALIWMLEKHDVDAYRYSDAIGDSRLARHRLVEAAWPRRARDDAPFRLSYIAERYLGDPGPPECEEIDSLFVPDKTLGVSLARCR